MFMFMFMFIISFSHSADINPTPPEKEISLLKVVKLYVASSYYKEKREV